MRIRSNDNASEGFVSASGTKEAIDHYYCYYCYQGEDDSIENKNWEQEDIVTNIKTKPLT